MNKINKKYKNYVGILIIFLGLLLNKYFIAKFFAPGGDINLTLYIINIIIFQFLIIISGISLIIKKIKIKNILHLTTLISLCIFLFLSIISGNKFFSTHQISINTKKSHKSLDQKMLDKVIYFKKNKIAQIDQKTSEIIYSLHQNKNFVAFKIPEDGILDTAIGMSPFIKNLFNGTVYFDISLHQENKESKILFKKDINLSLISKKEFKWKEVCIDLSKYQGKEIKLSFNKGYKFSYQKKPKKVYDLLPIDFMFFRKPIVRPKKIKNKYNIILISLDTLRADHLHYMGYPRKTSPNLDKLAKKGINFTTVISQSPWTTPSHFSILTSTYPSIHKGNQPVWEHQSRWNGKLPTLSSILKNKGYYAAAFTGGICVSAKLGFYKGFDFYYENNIKEIKLISDAKPIFQKSMRWLDNNKDRTFFLFIHTYEPHAPYINEFFVKKEELKKSDVVNHRIARYDGDIRYADLWIGKLIKRLRKLELIKNTIIIITSDHGENLGKIKRTAQDGSIHLGHGFSLYDELLLVPLIFYNPIIFQRQKSIDLQIRLIDILPTILDYLQYKGNYCFQGKSLRELIEGNNNKDRPAYSEAVTYGTERESLRVAGYKFIHRISYGFLSHPTREDYNLTPPYELYNLEKDPLEKNNIAENQMDKVRKFQELIISIFPQRKFQESGRDFFKTIKKDEELIEKLRSLGYIEK